MIQECDFVHPRPFVKWAGGKRQLISVLRKMMPASFRRYHEPFLGGGAVLFSLLSENPGLRCSVSDLNSELIEAYITIRDRPGDLLALLKRHRRGYAWDPEKYYYRVRGMAPRSALGRAARLIFLNRTCFNGLYRVNRHGKFNVPLGRYANPAIANEENIRAVSGALRSRRISISCRDFTNIRAEKGDFVYFDPPYQPVSRTSSFTSYTSRDFVQDDLYHLYEVSCRLDTGGCLVMHSNSDTPEIRKIFSQRPWRVRRISANRAINSNSARRTGHTELVITNY